MINHKLNDIQWLEFELLANCPKLIHGVFTRKGGCSQGHLASLNLSNNVGDSIENVNKNRYQVAQALSLPHLVCGQQCHGINISTITPFKLISPPSCDALTTLSKNIGIMILQADCQAAIFYDPVHHAIANAHCGWRGSVQNIYQHVIQRMQHDYQSRPEDLLVCISPSLGPENAEFINYKNELPESFWSFQTTQNHFNFWEISHWQLTNAGVLPHHIQIAGIDTFSHPEDYFSHRRCKHSGRHATICALA